MKYNFSLTVLLILLYLPNAIAQDSKISNTGTLPEYETKETPFKISGILYMSDGKTPAKDYILTINQANENGDFITDDNNNLITAATIKTDENGKYTFYSYIPGNDRRYNRLQEIFMKVETPTGDAYALPTLLFDTDPMLTKRCRKQIAKRSDVTRILKLKKTTDIFNVERDMVLSLNLERI